MRILVADDDEDTAELFQMLLQMAGHDVRTAADGQQAVDLAGTFRPQVAMLDIVMPVLDGYRAALDIRRLLPDALLMAVTGRQSRSKEREFRALFDYYLLKPFSGDTLLRMVNMRALPGGEPLVSQAPQSASLALC